ncbi:DivIVA domain-containing protein [Frankia sp. Mgl5]|uniref:DivIVA domain-containing protein n=1 Tax=Frankia sp. Mgl5 TaxID=2933793 RepID=UPI00200E8452|nr:DivIVA domain-containing protein [Frankia sp. Mgl5]MCK9927799.1 DivIVA domain-containing protein [Frankia sp. Mgl5]
MGAHHRRESPGAAMDRPTFDEAPQGYDPRQVDEYLGVLWRYASEVTSRAAAAEAALRHERDRREAEARLAEGLPAQAGGRIGLMLEIAQREAEDIIAGARHLAESALEEAVAQAGANHPIVREAREQAEKLILDAVEESRRLALTRHEDLEAEIVRGTHSLEALRRQQGEIIGAVLRLRRLLGGDEIDRAVTDLARAGVSPDGVAADSGRADAGAPVGPNLAGAPSVDPSAAPFTPGHPAAGPGHPAAPEQPGPPGQPGSQSQSQPGGAASSPHFPASDHAGHTGGVDSAGDPLRGPGGTGHAGTGQAGGVGPGGSAYAAAGYAAGHTGTGHTGTSHLGAGSVGLGHVGAGHVGASRAGASAPAGATSSGGSTHGAWAASSRLTAETSPAAPSAAAGAATVGSATAGARRGPGRHRQQQRDVPEAEPYPTDLAGGFVPGGPAAGGAGTGPVRMPAAGYRPAAEEDILDAEIVEE